MLPRADRKCFLLAHCQTIGTQSWFTVPRLVFLIGFPITISKLKILNWIYVESLETINKLWNLYLSLKPGTSPSPVTLVKSHEKKSQNYIPSMVKCCRNVNFEEIDTLYRLIPFNKKKWWILITNVRKI